MAEVYSVDIKKACALMGITQSDLAYAMYVTPVTVSHWAKRGTLTGAYALALSHIYETYKKTGVSPKRPKPQLAHVPLSTEQVAHLIYANETFVLEPGKQYALDSEGALVVDGAPIRYDNLEEIRASWRCPIVKHNGYFYPQTIAPVGASEVVASLDADLDSEGY